MSLVSGTGGLSKDEKAAIEERRKLAVAAAKSELDQKKAEYAARSKGFLWMELDSDEECDQDVESDDSEVKSGKESLAEDLCSEDGEVHSG